MSKRCLSGLRIPFRRCTGVETGFAVEGVFGSAQDELKSRHGCGKGSKRMSLRMNIIVITMIAGMSGFAPPAAGGASIRGETFAVGNALPVQVKIGYDGSHDNDAAKLLLSATDAGASPGENPANPVPAEAAAPAGELAVEQPADGTNAKQPINDRAADKDDAAGQMAQFQLPPPAAGTSGGPPRPVTQFLQYQYSFGTESDITLRRNPDLDTRLLDNSVIMAPQVNGFILYRPTADVETLLEMILEREIAVQEEQTVILPGGGVQSAAKRSTSLVVDQAYVKFYRALGPFDIAVGLKNYEDDRHWLYDTSLDTVQARARFGDFQTEVSVSRKDRFDLDLLKNAAKGYIDNYMIYVDYRGIDDIKLAGYAIFSHDHAGQEGRPKHLGLRAYGVPSEQFSFWGELAMLRGKDEFGLNFSASAVDVGFLYRFPDLPLYPSVTLGYANATGDDNPADNTNHEFRQTGLQSNEVKAAGVSKFKYYGETLDPELSNLQVATAGLGFRPMQSVYVDIFYHRYRLNAIADQIRNWALTAQMNQDVTQLSKDVGSAFDVVIGFRNVFGVRRLGIDVRAGWFFPGKAFRNEIAPGSGTFQAADKGVSAIVKFWL